MSSRKQAPVFDTDYTKFVLLFFPSQTQSSCRVAPGIPICQVTLGIHFCYPTGKKEYTTPIVLMFGTKLSLFITRHRNRKGWVYLGFIWITKLTNRLTHNVKIFKLKLNPSSTRLNQRRVEISNQRGIPKSTIMKSHRSTL